MNISVVGTRSVTLPAECVVVTLTVGFMGPDRDKVVADTAEVAEQVRAKLDEVTADDGGGDAKLTSLRTWTTIPYDDQGQPKTPQHVAQVRGSVRISDLSRVGPFLGELATKEGAQVGHLDWRLFDETLARLQPEVLAGAFGDALERAEWIAGAAGRANPVVESIEDNGTPSFAMARGKSAFMADSAPSFDLDPEDVEVSATLSVKFSTD